MRNLLQKYFYQRDHTLPRWFVLVALVLCFFGLLTSAYLTYEHYHGLQSLVCPLSNSYVDCNKVTTSEYSQIKFIGLPVAMLGVIYYGFMLAVFGLYLFNVSRLSFIWVTVISGIAFLFSLWLSYAQLIIIKTICSYCLLSALITIILFFLDLGMTMRILKPKKIILEEEILFSDDGKEEIIDEKIEIIE